MEFVDLQAQRMSIKDKIDAGIQRVLAHGKFILGPEVAELEEKLAAYTGAEYCITCANGADALQIAQMALGIGPGDEVITPGFTYYRHRRNRSRTSLILTGLRGLIAARKLRRAGPSQLRLGLPLCYYTCSVLQRCGFPWRRSWYTHHNFIP